MTATPLITAGLLTIALLALSVYLWRAHRREKRVSDNLLSWTEWERPRVWEIDVSVRPLEEKK